MMMAILFQESSFRAGTRPPRRWHFGFIPGRRPSSAHGYAQAVDATWEQFESEIGRRASRRRFADAAEFVGWYASELTDLLRLGRGDAASLYLAYHEGPGGYSRGSHLGKPGVLRSAGRVSARAGRFASQLEACRPALDRRLLWRTLRRWMAAVGLALVALILARQALRR